jgi:hypothetical protein
VKRSIRQSRAVDSDCESWPCRENTWYASPECKAFKHNPGQEFDKDLVVIVFVGSGFTDLMAWRMSVEKLLMHSTSLKCLSILILVTSHYMLTSWILMPIATFNAKEPRRFCALI